MPVRLEERVIQVCAGYVGVGCITTHCYTGCLFRPFACQYWLECNESLR